MAVRNFQNNSVDTFDAWTCTCALTFAAADTVTLTINGKTLVITVGTSVATTDVATGIKQAFNGETMTNGYTCVPQAGGDEIPEFAELLATVSGSVVTFTSVLAGVPHVFTTGDVATTAGNGTATVANSVVCSGKYFGNNVNNWREGATPVDGDDIVIDGPFKWLYGVAFSAIQPASITFGPKCTGDTQVGLPFQNANGYAEYRTPELAIGPVVVNVRGPVGLVKINAGTDGMTANVYDGGTSLEDGFYPCQFRGTHATDNVVNVYGGKASIAARGETAVCTTIRRTGGTLIVGNNVSFTTIQGTVTVMAD